MGLAINTFIGDTGYRAGGYSFFEKAVLYSFVCYRVVINRMRFLLKIELYMQKLIAFGVYSYAKGLCLCNDVPVRREPSTRPLVHLSTYITQTENYKHNIKKV
jgi:hypothetical protein